LQSTNKTFSFARQDVLWHYRAMNGAHLRVTMFLLFCAITLSAQTPCTVVVPVTVVTQDGTIVKDLPRETLTTQTKEISLQPDFAADDSKRRILIVLDGSPDLQKASVEAEKYMARAIVESARPDDSFALISGNAAPLRMEFGADKALVLKAIDRFPKGRKGKKLSLPDAVYEGSTWFGTPEFGDSVLVLPGSAKRPESLPELSGEGLKGLALDKLIKDGTDLDLGNRGWDTSNPPDRPAVPRLVKSSIEPKNLNNALIDHGLRLFVASQPGTFNRTQADISLNSGGLHYYLYPELGRGKRNFRLDDASRNVLSAEASRIYDAIALTYRVSVLSSETLQTPISIELRPEITNKLPNVSAYYPSAIPGCPSKR
jgi:hypothetical protein